MVTDSRCRTGHGLVGPFRSQRSASLDLGRLQVLIAIAITVLLAAQKPAFAEPQHRNVLILYSYNDLIPWEARIHTALEQRLDQFAIGDRPNVFEERLDATRIDKRVSGPALAVYLRAKYQALHFEAVIAESSAATHVLLDNPDLFADARRYAIDPGIEVPAPATGIEVLHAQGDWARGSLRTLAAVMPGLKRVVVVVDVCPVGQANKAKILAAADALPAGVSLDVWDRFTFAELYRDGARLPPGTVLFYTPVFMDRDDQRETPMAVVQGLAAVVPVPIFTEHDLYIGKGVVGGRVLSSERFGAMMADLAMSPGYAERWKDAQDLLNPVMFDDAQLRRWNIADRQLPPDAIVVGRKLSVWWQYRAEIGLTILALLVESGLILWLLRALYQRDQAVRDVVQQKDELEVKVAERTRDLEDAKRGLEGSNAHLRDLADTDPLTAVANRRKLLSTLDSEWNRAAQDATELSVLMLDIDRFKTINDGHGHVTGDLVIQAFAGLCRSQLPAKGCIGRLGGEEFGVVLPNTSIPQATACAERIRAAVKASPVPAGPGIAIEVTVSIGVSRRTGPSDTPGALMARADAALYEAKRNGRDRVVSRSEAIHGRGSDAALAAVAAG